MKCNKFSQIKGGNTPFGRNDHHGNQKEEILFVNKRKETRNRRSST